MKKVIGLVLAFIMAFSVVIGLAGCSAANDKTPIQILRDELVEKGEKTEWDYRFTKEATNDGSSVAYTISTDENRAIDADGQTERNGEQGVCFEMDVMYYNTKLSFMIAPYDGRESYLAMLSLTTDRAYCAELIMIPDKYPSDDCYIYDAVSDSFSELDLSLEDLVSNSADILLAGINVMLAENNTGLTVNDFGFNME